MQVARVTTLYAVEVASPDTAAIQAELEERLVAAGLYEPEKRPFWPHVTVARVRAEKGAEAAPRAVARPPAAAAGGAPRALRWRPNRSLPFADPGRRVPSTPRWHNLSCRCDGWQMR